MSIREPRDFEKFKEELRPEEDGVYVSRLLERHLKAEQRLLRTHKGEDEIERRKAVRDFALVVMASERLLSGVVHEPNKPPSWMDTARDMIDEFVNEHKSDRSMLRETVFFGEAETRMRFAHNIGASVVPRGEYEDEVFANGVALGRIGLRN